MIVHIPKRTTHDRVDCLPEDTKAAREAPFATNNFYIEHLTGEVHAAATVPMPPSPSPSPDTQYSI
jgi:hypothetical protein